MVEKMKLLHITGPKNDVDRVMEQYLSRYEIHFENAASGFGISGHVRPFAEDKYLQGCMHKGTGVVGTLKGRARWGSRLCHAGKNGASGSGKSGGSGIPADR